MNSSKEIIKYIIWVLEQYLSKHQGDMPLEDVLLLKRAIEALQKELDNTQKNPLKDLMKNPVVQMTLFKLIEWFVR